MDKKVLMIKGVSRYNVLRVAADGIAKGFQEKGYQVEVLDANTMEEYNSLWDKLQNESYSFIFSCQALLFDKMQENGRPFLECVKSPYIGWIFDDMIYHLPRVENQIFDHSHLFFTDEEMKNIALSMYPTLTNVGGLLHGGFSPVEEQAKKDIEVLFPGTLDKEPKIEDIIKEPMPIERTISERTITQLKQTPWLSVRKALEIVMQSLGEELNGELLEELSGVVLYVDAYIRYSCRYEMMKVLLEDGIHIHVVGAGSNDLLEQYKDNITVCGTKDITEVIRLIQRSKVVINPLPVVFLRGAHERIFTAMLNKAVCFTPYSEYLKEMLGERVKFIDMKHLQRMADDVRNVLDNYETEEMQKYLEDNVRDGEKHHTWKVRGREIAEYFQAIYGES